MSYCYKPVNQREALDKMGYPIVLSLLFRLNLVTEFHNLDRSVCHVQCVIFNPNLLYLDSIGFPHLFESIGLSLTTRLNYFFLET